MFFVFTTIFDPLGLPHPLLKARHFGFFEIFFLDLAYGLSHTPHATQDLIILFHRTKPDRRPDAPATARLTPIERCLGRALSRQARANQLVCASNQSKHTGVCVGGNIPSSPLSTRLVFITPMSKKFKVCSFPNQGCERP